MAIIDLIILGILGVFVLSGFWFGAIHMIGAVIGVIIGTIAAGRYNDPVADWLTPLFNGNANLAIVIATFLVFVIVVRLVALAVFLLDKVFKFIAIIPFVKTFNRLLGAGLALIEGSAALGLAFYFASKFPVGGLLEASMRNSTLFKPLRAIGSVLALLLPEAIRVLKSAF